MMGRAPNPGGPQRVSAHVVPKASLHDRATKKRRRRSKPGWEDEASTTVEQGDVAERFARSRRRARGAPPHNTNITGTAARSTSPPSTISAHAALSLITPLRSAARLVITQGNDAGQESSPAGQDVHDRSRGR